MKKSSRFVNTVNGRALREQARAFLGSFRHYAQTEPARARACYGAAKLCLKKAANEVVI